MIDTAALTTRLAQRDTLVLDGGLGSELSARGHRIDDALWSARLLVEAPDAIAAVHADYLRAGADVIVTASYQASVPGFAAFGIDAHTALAHIRAAIDLAAAARTATGRSDAWIAASVGPYGAARADGSEFTGCYDLDEPALADWHRARIAALAQGGADLLACETLPSLAEARALVRVLAEQPHASAWLSFACRDEAHISDGTNLAECARLADGVDQVLAIGVNCTAPQHVEALIRRLRAATAKPIVVYPNAGQTWDATAKRWLGAASALTLADLAPRWRDAGARLIGGCCGTRPKDIAALRAALG